MLIGLIKKTYFLFIFLLFAVFQSQEVILSLSYFIGNLLNISLKKIGNGQSLEPKNWNFSVKMKF